MHSINWLLWHSKPWQWPILCFVLGIACYALPVALSSKSQWRDDVIRYEKSIAPETKQACKQALSACDEIVEQNRKAYERGERKFDVIESLYGADQCLKELQSKSGLICSAENPREFSRYAINKVASSAFLEVMIAALGVIASILIVIRSIRNEKHLGWKRVQLAVIPACAATGYWLMSDEAVAKQIGFGLGLMVAAAGMRRLAIWVGAGFDRERAKAPAGDASAGLAAGIEAAGALGAQAQSAAPSAAAPRSPHEQVPWLQLAAVVIILGVTASVAATNPGQLIAAAAAGVTQLVGVVALVYLARWYRGRRQQ